jgi:DNA-binding HxlR family transcriptional regulator
MGSLREDGAMKGYGQFCPVAKSAEILAERWTPLVLRELLMGSEHFNDIRRGVPLMSPTLLSRRLRSLHEAGVVERERVDGRTAYRLTQAGRELQPLIEHMAKWGNRWVGSRLTPDDLDPSLLMWDIRRNLDPGQSMESSAVIQVEFPDVERKWSRWWLIVDPETIDLCLTDPGREVDLVVRTTLQTLTAIWIGHRHFEEAMRIDDVQLLGDEDLKRLFPAWLGQSPSTTL